MAKISVLLPSLRLTLCWSRIKEFVENNVDYEIIVVSSYMKTSTTLLPGMDKVVWIQEETQEGSVFATNRAFDASTGDYVIYFSDDVAPTVGCLDRMYEFMRTKTSPFIGAFKMETSLRKEIGPFGAYGKLYACYGCLSRETAKRLGGLFNPALLYSWADIDLSLRCWSNMGKVEICRDAIVIPSQVEDEIYIEHRTKYWRHDVEIFKDVWHPKLGGGSDWVEGEVNRRL